MFIFNVKVNGSKLFKVFFTFVIILMIGILCAVFYKVISGSNKSFSVSDNLDSSGVCKISAKNYTNILKTVHENIDNYVGKKINFTVVVGVLCECDSAKNFANDTWVEVTGEIVKGSYHGDMPIVRITDIKAVDTPKEEYVYPPDDSYIPTSGVL